MLAPLTCLPGSMNDGNIHGQFNLVLDLGVVSSCHLVGPLNGLGGDVCPVDIVLILRQTHWVWKL